MNASARLTLLGLLLFCTGHDAVGQPTLGLDEVLAAVERSHPLLVSARLDRDTADGELQVAKGAFDPSLKARATIQPFGYYENQRLDAYIEAPTPLYGATFYGGYRLGLGNIPDYDGKLATNAGGELRAGVAVPLLRDGYIDRRRVGLSRAKIGIDLAGLSVAQARIELRRAATQRYWEWIAAGARLRIVEALLTLSRTRDTVVALRIAHGDLPAIERTENARAIAQREAQVFLARRGLEQATIELSLLLRDATGSPRLAGIDELPAAMPEPGATPEVDADLREAVSRRPEPRRVSLLRTQGELDLRLAQNQLLPALDLSFVVSKDLGSGLASRDPAAGELGITLDFPLLFRSGLGRLGVARAGLRRTDQQLRFARDRVSAEVRDAGSAIAGAHARLTATRKELGLARELEAAERQRFDLGDSTLFFVNLREQSTAEAALREVDSMLDYHRAVAAYEAAVAR